MFDIEQSIAEWRRRMLAADIKAAPLDELESHLRQEMENRIRTGLSAAQAFNAAVRRIGPADALRLEFSKLGVKSWNRRLAWIAWAMFLVSFFLPSYAEWLGWQCALLQPLFWSNALHGSWTSVHYELLTPANLLMLASSLLLFKFGGSPRVLKWFRHLALTASLLVWSFIGLLLVSGDKGDLKLGCYVWGISFVLLHMSVLSLRVRQKQYAVI
jgi:hypothetical protein